MEIYVGFDSAWTDNAKAPGAICALARRDDGFDFVPPRLARFAEAAAFIEALTTPDAFMIIALDQPTRVPNLEGGRPAERVAASVVSRLGGGVQPARRGGGGASMFGDTAPVWPFLARLNATEAPLEARFATRGRYLIEVFPALALPSMIPAIWSRGRAAKYNPVTPTYQPDDWPLVCAGAAAFANALGIAPVVSWLLAAAENTRPTKSDQDRLDAVICLLVACHWRMGEPDASVVIGDLHNGYIVTPATHEISAVLKASASVRGVPIDDPGVARSDCLNAPAKLLDVSAVPLAPPLTVVSAASRRVRLTPRSSQNGGSAFRVEARALRALLVQLAKHGRLITYGEVASHFGQPWHQGFGASLTRALNEIGSENKRRGEPDLMGIVVNKVTRLPGEGFFISLGLITSTPERRLIVHEEQLLARRLYPWPDDYGS